MDFLLTFALIVLLVVVPVVAGMAMGYGLEDNSAMSTDPVSVLLAIVEEVSGAGQPFSSDSYLPAHLIHDARQAIDGAQDAVPESALEAHEKILLARLAKADEMIASLRAEIDSLRRPNIPVLPPVVVSGPAQIVFDPSGKFVDEPFQRLTAYGRHPECDA